MKNTHLLCNVMAAVLSAAMFSGCVSRADFDKCVNRNDIQRQRIEQLEAAQEAERLRAEKYHQEYELSGKRDDYWQQKIDIMQAALDAEKARTAYLASQIGQVALPVELSNALTDWARQSGSDLVTFDERTGIVRFKSDLLFDSGSDVVKPTAAASLAKLTGILKSSLAERFDIVVVGHTDDQPIKYSAARHPTNWHLSAHRAIAVQKVLSVAGLDDTRTVVMGAGQFQPVEANAADGKGNPKNRRVDIYVVPAGAFYSSQTAN